MPIVSVIMPIYNRSRYLEEAVASVLNQTYGDFEIIIVDDGSTEPIDDILEKCIQKSPEKIRCIHQENKGPAGARNFGIREARGQYVAFLDADDEWKPDYLEKTVAKLKDGEYQWVATGSCKVGLDEKEEEVYRKEIHTEPLENYGDLYGELLKENIIGGPSQVIINKDCFQKTPSFRQDLRIREDWEMWIRLAKCSFKATRVAEPLYVYKIRENSITKTDYAIGFACTYKILGEYSKEAFSYDSANREFYAERMWNIARHILYKRTRNYLLFLKCVIKSQFYHPSFRRITKSVGTLTQT